ncbi:MAG: hypothetical protein P8J20_16905 [Novosphingobium sp.]|nr:hypothetical protein [Novosphingobium sp.]
MKHLLLAAIAALTSTLVLASPAAAQGESERVNQLIIYGEDTCPPSSGDQITVCARKDESERYRIPEALRESSSPQNEAWNNRVLAYETVGKGGTLSCSPVGGGGWTGCVSHMIDTAMAEKDSDPSLRFSELIAEERARRLATIDADASDQQTRVEEAERAYFERQQQAAEAAEAGEGSTEEGSAQVPTSGE